MWFASIPVAEGLLTYFRLFYFSDQSWAINDLLISSCVFYCLNNEVTVCVAVLFILYSYLPTIMSLYLCTYILGVLPIKPESTKYIHWRLLHFSIYLLVNYYEYTVKCLLFYITWKKLCKMSVQLSDMWTINWVSNLWVIPFCWFYVGYLVVLPDFSLKMCTVLNRWDLVSWSAS